MPTQPSWGTLTYMDFGRQQQWLKGTAPVVRAPLACSSPNQEKVHGSSVGLRLNWGTLMSLRLNQGDWTSHLTPDPLRPWGPSSNLILGPSQTQSSWTWWKDTRECEHRGDYTAGLIVQPICSGCPGSKWQASILSGRRRSGFCHDPWRAWVWVLGRQTKGSFTPDIVATGGGSLAWLRASVCLPSGLRGELRTKPHPLQPKECQQTLSSPVFLAVTLQVFPEKFLSWWGNFSLWSFSFS